MNDNCYYGSVGPTTNAGSDTPPRPTNPVLSQLLKPNFGRVRVPPGLWHPRHHRRFVEHDRVLRRPGRGLDAIVAPGNMIMGAGLSGNAYFLNANQNPALVIADLQTCSRQYVASNSGNISVGHGHDWGVGGMGATLFNTIAPPTAPCTHGPHAEPTAQAAATGRAWTIPTPRATTLVGLTPASPTAASSSSKAQSP